jgi:ABC-2 type transport system ATP-binding protein
LAGAPVIEVANLVKRYGDLTAVDGITFTVYQNEIFGMLGPNGAGKTTTLEILEGLRQPTSGSIRVVGLDVTRQPRAVKQRIGVQLQASSFFEHLNLVELLELFGDLYGRTVDAMAILRDVELEEKAKSEVKKLSGGQKQRFSIAAALVNDPEILFLDEPTTGLDPQARRHLWDLVSKIRATGKTILITTHYMEEAEVLCDRVAVVDRGHIIAMNSPSSLIGELLAGGFHKEVVQQAADLEDVFLNLTGHALRED